MHLVPRVRPPQACGTHGPAKAFRTHGPPEAFRPAEACGTHGVPEAFRTYGPPEARDTIHGAIDGWKHGSKIIPEQIAQDVLMYRLSH